MLLEVKTEDSINCTKLDTFDYLILNENDRSKIIN